MDADGSTPARTSAPDPAGTPRGDFAYEAFFTGAIGGVVIALFFLAVDALAGHVFFTPSLMGAALVSDTPVSDDVAVRLDRVALYTLVHFGVFLVLGAVASSIRGAALSSGGVVALGAAIFVIMTGAFWIGTTTVLAGVGSAIGWPLVLAANLVTSIAMTAFLNQAHPPG